ncbi:class I SAM-dependent methyltransferase [Candidatus Uhrbacteria bacterium]|nr:class I SAM-dependent methyltransferase [Candidatus Uhrbacteria bacterium]
MDSIELFGKPIEPLLRHKKSFFTDNDAILENSKRIGEIYKVQPLRTACKNCGAPKPSAPEEFIKQGIPYWFCAQCGHLTGAYDDSDEFCAQVYTGSGSENYAKNYATQTKEEYHRRLQDIYVPKAKFLIDALTKEGMDPSEQKYADFGAGSGYFAGALYESGLRRIAGYEPSPHQVDFGNRMLPAPLLKCTPLTDFENLAATTDSTVVSMIGVMEHFQYPRAIMKSLAENSAVQYVYILIPLFSPAIFFELAFPEVVQRVLGGRHTHIYTQESISWLCNEFGFEQCGAWWFGTDIADIFRDVFVTLTKQGHSGSLIERWKEMFLPLIDQMQMVVDKNKVCSEGHLLFKKKSRA